MKNKLRVVVLMVLSFGLGIGVPLVVDVLRHLACNLECKAQLLYKNAAFFEMRGAVTSKKQDSATKVTIDQSRYTTEYLRESGIDLLVVMDSGEFVITSRLDKLAMLAKPTFDGKQLTWHCQFFSDAVKSPSERPCSY